MKIEDEACLARGFAVPSFVDLRTGRRLSFNERHNKLSFMSAEAMAAAFGGDPSYIPARVGFIYGDQAQMPTGAETITRNQSWDRLLQELSSNDVSSTVDIQVVQFSYHPTLGGDNPSPGESSSGSSSSSSDSSDSGDDSSSEDYNNILSTGSNAITFHAVSNSQDAGAAFGTGAFVSGRYIYQAVLLGKHNGKYYVISRVSLKENGSYLTKPSGFEIALDWTIVFK